MCHLPHSHQQIHLVPGFAGLCKAMQPADVNSFAYLCQALMLVDSPEALSVLDPSTGKFLKHCRLSRDPRYKAIWDTSYPMNLDGYAKA